MARHGPARHGKARRGEVPNGEQKGRSDMSEKQAIHPQYDLEAAMVRLDTAGILKDALDGDVISWEVIGKASQLAQPQRLGARIRGWLWRIRRLECSLSQSSGVRILTSGDRAKRQEKHNDHVYRTGKRRLARSAAIKVDDLTPEQRTRLDHEVKGTARMMSVAEDHRRERKTLTGGPEANPIRPRLKAVPEK